MLGNKSKRINLSCRGGVSEILLTITMTG